MPLSQEHHHHLVLENSYVRVYEVEVPGHQATLMHQHDQDYVYVVFGESDIDNTVAGQPTVRVELADGAVNFSRGPFAHIALNNLSASFRNITIVLLRPQGREHVEASTIDAALDGSAPQLARPSALQGVRQAAILETEQTRVSAVGIARGSQWQPEKNGRERLVVFFDRIADPNVPREPKARMFPAGMWRWISTSSTEPLYNSGTREMRLLVLEFQP